MGPLCLPTNPSGQVAILCDDPDFVMSDDYCRMIRYPNPEADNWTLYILGMNKPAQRSYIWAHSDNPDIECSAGAASGYFDSEVASGTFLTATASNGAPLGRDTL